MPRETPRWRKLYKGRASVERESGRLKNDWALAPLRVRGLERVQLHADLTILAKLARALARARLVAIAAQPPRRHQHRGKKSDAGKAAGDCHADELVAV